MITQHLIYTAMSWKTSWQHELRVNEFQSPEKNWAILPDKYKYAQSFRGTRAHSVPVSSFNTGALK